VLISSILASNNCGGALTINFRFFFSTGIEIKSIVEDTFLFFLFDFGTIIVSYFFDDFGRNTELLLIDFCLFGYKRLTELLLIDLFGYTRLNELYDFFIILARGSIDFFNYWTIGYKSYPELFSSLLIF